MMNDSKCVSCTGNCEACSGCGGCGGALELHPGEIHILRTLGQIPFLPVARRGESMEPHYLEETAYSSEEYSLILHCLEKRGLISVDYAPMTGFDYGAYDGFPVHGSFGLTEKGQTVLELLEIQGIE